MNVHVVMYYTNSKARKVLDKCTKNSTISNEIACDITSKLCRNTRCIKLMSEIFSDSNLCN